jgi:hypothetical protein
LPIDITIQKTWELFKQQGGCCALSGLPLDIRDGSASLDRIDNTRGYGSGNIQWIHKTLNHMKNDFPQPRFLELCRLVAKHKGII